MSDALPAKSDWPFWLAPFKPPFETLKHYNGHKFRKDILAGLTVSVVEVPQSMAYAIVAGVPPQYGLYTSVIQGIVGALLSSSEHMTTGPTNTQSLLIASAVHRLADPTGSPETYLQLVFALTLLKGLIQLAFAAAQMGNMVRYVSRSVIAGLVSGAGFLIFFGQLPAFLGIHTKTKTDLPGILAPMFRVIHDHGEMNLRAVVIGLAVVGITVGTRAISRLLPGALVGVILSATVVWLMGWTDSIVPLIQKIPQGIPHFHLPSLGWVEAESLFGGALALAVIGMIESVAIAKSIAARTGEEINPNQEFFAQGFKNSLSSFFQCIPGSGSFTRSALDYAAGAETRFAAVFNACFVGLIFWFLAEQAQYIPQAALAGLLFVIAAGLVEWGYIPRVFRSSRPDAIVCGITFGATMLVPLEYAIFIGVFLNIALYLRQSSRLHVTEMIEGAPGGPFQERELTDRSGGRQVMFLQVEGDLFFGVADELRDRLAALSREGSGVKVVVFRLRRTHSIDSTALYVFDQFTRDMQARKGHVVLCGVRPDLTPVLRNFGLIDLIGKENFFETGLGVFASAKAALERAKQLAGVSIDIASLSASLQDEALMYEI
ncbi:SulP family inorganic anion transporter [soil metagenome]